jgi:hypothetical protein
MSAERELELTAINVLRIEMARHHAAQYQIVRAWRDRLRDEVTAQPEGEPLVVPLPRRRRR